MRFEVARAKYNDSGIVLMGRAAKRKKQNVKQHYPSIVIFSTSYLEPHYLVVESKSPDQSLLARNRFERILCTRVQLYKVTSILDLKLDCQS